MAKDNLFLGMARGSVGDVVFSRLDGVQVSRSRNRSPRNPRTPLQLLQRVVMATVGKAYTFFSPLADHSYEGETGLQGSQRAFVAENVDLLRNQLAELIAYPLDSRMENSDLLNYSFVGDVGPVYNPYVISKGSLPPADMVYISEEEGGPFYILGLKTNLTAIPNPITSFTYQAACDALGLMPGDQITVVGAYTDPDAFSQTFVSLQYARIILMPGSGDMTVPFIASGGGINDPNERNMGTFATGGPAIYSDTTMGVYLGLDLPDGNPLTLAAGCIIISRQDPSGIWLRSKETLKVLSGGFGILDDHQFGDAYISHKRYTASSLYLNQAEGG